TRPTVRCATFPQRRTTGCTSVDTRSSRNPPRTSETLGLEEEATHGPQAGTSRERVSPCSVLRASRWAAWDRRVSGPREGGARDGDCSDDRRIKVQTGAGCRPRWRHRRMEEYLDAAAYRNRPCPA